MKSLIISDCHDKTDQIQRIMDAEPADEVILQGDFFDDWKTAEVTAVKTATKVKEWLNDPRIVCLLGNHDASYGYGHRPGGRFHLCSGWTKEKAIAIHSVLEPANWLKFQLHHWIEAWERPFLATHAGIHLGFVQKSTHKTHQQRLARIDSLCYEAWVSLNSSEAGTGHPILYAGVDRGGAHDIGGLLWCDFGGLKPIPGINQIVGHTFKKEVREIRTNTSYNVCIDTAQRHYILVTDGSMQLKEVKV
jgi:hypothetical protein